MLRPLVEAVDSPAVPIALRSRMALAEPASWNPAIDPAWRSAFAAALALARGWRLAAAIEAFRGLERAGDRRAVIVNIGLLCEWLARPAEAAEVWREVAWLAGMPRDVAVEAIGRAIVLEMEADPGLGPRVSFVESAAALDDAAVDPCGS